VRLVLLLMTAKDEHMRYLSKLKTLYRFHTRRSLRASRYKALERYKEYNYYI
jgi:hypothetical protein